MKRWIVRVIMLCHAPLLLGAAPLAMTVEPATPTFGKIVTVHVTLPDDVVPGGLPALSPFIALAAPRIEANHYRLLLLPLGSGSVTLPSLSFVRGVSEHFYTAPLTLEIRDDIPPDAVLIPPPSPPRNTVPLGKVAALLLAGSVALWALRAPSRRPLPPQRPPSLADFSGAELLAELDRRISSDRELPAAEQHLWRQRLDAARFSAPEARTATARQLLTEYLRHSGEKRCS
ncbi:MAG: hypothetical protein P1P74_09635 [Desulfuromonadales bacterium]|nr:hypothetical protein [Desulfuromonadales bacterium]MDT8423407.1 hypothetical protein [Desulfuromonadales bacterium]